MFRKASILCPLPVPFPNNRRTSCLSDPSLRTEMHRKCKAFQLVCHATETGEESWVTFILLHLRGWVPGTALPCELQLCWAAVALTHSRKTPWEHSRASSLSSHTKKGLPASSSTPFGHTRGLLHVLDKHQLHRPYHLLLLLCYV